MNNLTHTSLHSDGMLPVTRVRRMPLEWDLIEIDRDEKNGITTLIYERTYRNADGLVVTETASRTEERPTHRAHRGWRMFNGRFTN